MGGFDNLIFEGVEDGKNKVLSSTGASGANDPSYQLFEKAIGLTFDGPLQSSQKDFQ